jgi:NADH-quinone oxidoreductase subunit H
VIAAAAAAFGKCAFLLGAVLAGSSFMIWAERKQSAMMQDRIGANRADIFGFRAIGLFHIISDAVKTLTKEDYIPPFVDKALFWLAPFIAGAAATIGLVVIPFGPTVQVLGFELPMAIMRSEIGMLILFGSLGLTIYGSFLAGISSNNKYGMLGGVRAAAQMASYEAALGLSLVGLFMVFGSLDLSAIANAQRGWLPWLSWLPNWGIFVQPLGFLLFLTAAIAETKRIPFDIPEGESEIIGYFIEYSGMKFSIFLMSEFVETILFSAAITVLFFGGWHLPGIDYASLPAWLALAAGAAIFWGKVAVGCWFFLLVRWTLPRLRYDQLLDLGWRYLLPASLANILLTGAVLLLMGRLA